MKQSVALTQSRVIVMVGLALGCSGSPSGGGETSVGGSTVGFGGAGGLSANTGGMSGSGGAINIGGFASGGALSNGGSSVTGSSSTGGVVNGGASSPGGASIGGIANGVGGSAGQSSIGNAPLAPTDLNIADRAGPLNVEGTPLFGWVPNDTDGNEIQSAYEIQLTRVSDGVVVWDSGKVISGAESFVPYSGPVLAAGTSYVWTVRTWDRTDQVSPWAPAASFDTGLADADWNASWIRRSSTEADDYTLARREVTLGSSPVTRARAYVSANHQFELRLNGNVVEPWTRIFISR